jgi:hypothetical protein
MSRLVLLLTSMAAALLLASGGALALPSERPDNTRMVNGTVRAIEQVGINMWLGGDFSKVKQRNGTVVASVSNVAVLDSKTNQYKDIAPELSGKDSEVWDMTLYGDDVLIGGKFSGPSSKNNNLVLVDGETGKVLKWFNAPALKSVLAAPDLGRVYGGGQSLSAFEFAPGKKRPLWTRAKTTVDESLYPKVPSPGYRDLELDADGKTIWAACACDAVDDEPAKSLIKLSTEGVHEASWRAAADPPSWGMSLVEANGALYLGVGGSDLLASFSKAGGNPTWVRDASGAVQVVEVMEDKLMIGGHFWEVADQAAGQPEDYCTFGRSKPELDPKDECQTRKGIAAYSFDGVLEPNWAPEYAGGYGLVWALHVQGSTLHTGGEFLTVNGVNQNYYARLSPSPS